MECSFATSPHAGRDQPPAGACICSTAFVASTTSSIDANATPLTEEVLKEMQRPRHSLWRYLTPKNFGPVRASRSGLASIKPHQKRRAIESGKNFSENGTRLCKSSETSERRS